MSNASRPIVSFEELEGEIAKGDEELIISWVDFYHPFKIPDLLKTLQKYPNLKKLCLFFLHRRSLPAVEERPVLLDFLGRLPGVELHLGAGGARKLAVIVEWVAPHFRIAGLNVTHFFFEKDEEAAHITYELFLKYGPFGVLFATGIAQEAFKKSVFLPPLPINKRRRF